MILVIGVENRVLVGCEVLVHRILRIVNEARFIWYLCIFIFIFSLFLIKYVGSNWVINGLDWCSNDFYFFFFIIGWQECFREQLFKFFCFLIMCFGYIFLWLCMHNVALSFRVSYDIILAIHNDYVMSEFRIDSILLKFEVTNQLKKSLL